MNKPPKYFFQLTAEDIAKMLAAGNVKQGRGIIVVNNGDSLEISIDEKYIIDCIWSFIRSGNVMSGAPYAPCTVPHTIKDTRDSVSLDPNRYQ